MRCKRSLGWSWSWVHSQPAERNLRNGVTRLKVERPLSLIERFCCLFPVRQEVLVLGALVHVCW